jgi:molecular chaperone GrpE
MADNVKTPAEGQPLGGKDEKQEVKKEEKATAKAAPSPLEELQKKYDELKAEYDKTAESEAKWKNSYYLELADTQNLRKSLEEDHRNAMRYRAEGFLDNLLPALDSFYVALSANPQSPEAKNYQQGFQYIYNQIQNSLTSEGVSELLPKVGDHFDATYMHAVDVKEADEDGKILQVYSKGYKLHDRLIRPAMVCVSKKKTEEKPATEAHKA